MSIIFLVCILKDNDFSRRDAFGNSIFGLTQAFTDDIQGVMLQPSEVNGSFIIRIDGKEIFDRKKLGRFPETKELKQLVRGSVNPEKDLGHSDRKSSA